MTQGGQPPYNGDQFSELESVLRELLEAIRGLQPRRRPFRRGLTWVLAVCAAPIIAFYVVPSAHRAFTTADCYAKYWFLPSETQPSSSEWEQFGVTSVKALSPTAVSIRPSAVGDIWFGAVLPFTRYCDYTLSFSAELVGPLRPAAVGIIGYGYAIGARGTAINGIPSATTVQFDPPQGGLRTVPIPCCANRPGYNPQQLPGVVAGTLHRWALRVIGATAYVSFDGKGYGSMTLSHGNDVLVRVWNADVIIKNLVIRSLNPWP
jgi:hypothetical protein